jgi:DNA-binding CsgD family transcriptional regulator
MGFGTVVSGLITFVLGFLVLADIYGTRVLPFSMAAVGILLTRTGALVLFGAMVVIGVALIVNGAVSDDRAIIVREVDKAVGKRVAYDTLSELDLTILRLLSQKKNAKQISEITRVDHHVISKKILRLRMEGYITEKDELTEKGFEALRRTEVVIAKSPA